MGTPLQSFQSHGVRRDWQGAHDAQAAATVEHGLVRAAERFNVQSQRRARKSVPEFLGRFGNRFNRKKHVHDRGEFRLEATGNSFRACLEQIDIGHDAARIGNQLNAGGGEFWVALGTIEKNDTELCFEVADEFADSRLRAMQLARAGRKTALIDCGDEGPQLVQRDAIQHEFWPYR